MVEMVLYKANLQYILQNWSSGGEATETLEHFYVTANEIY